VRVTVGSNDPEVKRPAPWDNRRAMRWRLPVLAVMLACAAAAPNLLCLALAKESNQPRPTIDEEAMRLLASYNTGRGQWHIPGGSYRLALGHSAGDYTVEADVSLAESWFGR